MNLSGLPDLQVHDNLPLVHIFCVNFHSIHSQRLQKKNRGHDTTEIRPAVKALFNVY